MPFNLLNNCCALPVNLSRYHRIVSLLLLAIGPFPQLFVAFVSLFLGSLYHDFLDFAISFQPPLIAVVFSRPAKIKLHK